MCCGWVAGRLAKLIGLPSPEIRIGEVPSDLITGSSRPDVAHLGVGPVFASRIIEGAQEVTMVDIARVPVDVQRLVLLFDSWVHNEDRFPTEFGRIPNLVWSQAAGGLVTFDLNLAFDPEPNPVRFWETHTFRSAAAGWDPGSRTAVETKLGNALSRLDDLWPELPASWLFQEGEGAGSAAPESASALIAGEHGAIVAAWLATLENAAFSPAQSARLLLAVVNGRHRDRSLVPDLMLSGPDVPGVPTADTYAVVQSLFQEAQNEIVLAGYAFHIGKLLFERLAEQKRRRPGGKKCSSTSMSPNGLETGETGTAVAGVRRSLVGRDRTTHATPNSA